MTHMRRKTLFFVGALVALIDLGCQSVYRSRPVEVLVRDAETQEPIREASVQIAHHHTSSETSIGVSAGDGIALIDFVPKGSEPAMISVSGHGFREETKVVTDEEIIQIEPRPLLGDFAPHKPDFIIDVFADPVFEVVIVTPRDFRGLVRAEVDFHEKTFERGLRRFMNTANAKGEVKLRGPEILKRLPMAGYRARYEGDENPMGPMTATEVGIRWLKKEGNLEMFVVGTDAEFEQFRKELVPQANMNPSTSDSPKRGGRGGGGRGRGGRGSGGGNQ